MNFLSRIWDKVKHSESVLYPTFQIDVAKILDDNSRMGKPIVARKNYFEITLTEQFLKDRREYWNEYIPLTVFLTEFIYDKKRSAFPFVIGPDLLKSIEQLEGNESIRYTNTRVVGPTPYRGDNVALFSGLFRIKTRNWAKQTISLVESVAKAFDTSKLSGYLNVADPLLNGIEGFLGMDGDTQFRIGQRNEYRDSATHSREIFESGFWVMVKEDQSNVKKENFWIKDGQLHYGTKKETIKPYRKSDYILYEINSLDIRNDYETFDFHNHWENAREAIIKKNLDQANSEFQSLTVNLLRSHDIIDPQKNQLLMMYSGLFEDMKGAFINKASISDVFTSLRSNKKALEAQGIKIDMGERVSAIATDFVNKSSGNFKKKNFVIDQQFIKEALESTALNQPDLLNMDSFEIGAMNPTVDLL